MYIQETYINKTKGHRIGLSDVFEAWTDDKGELFRSLRREYGRCIGKVHIEQGGKARTIGWVFEGRDTYQGCDDTYLREVWVIVHREPPTKTITYSYLDI